MNDMKKPFARKLSEREGFALPASLAFLLSSMILVANPLMVYSHDSVNFGAIWLPMLAYGGALSLGIALVVAAAVCFLKPDSRLRGLCTWALLAAVLCAFSYSYLIPSDFGTLQGDRLMNSGAMLKSRPFYCGEFALLVGLGVVAFWLKRFVPDDILLCVSVLLSIALNLTGIIPCLLSGIDRAEGECRPSAQSAIKISRTAPNIVVFLLDMVQGASFKQVVDDPRLSSRLDGFVWYPNSLSVSQYTSASVPAIFGGSEGDPARLNEDATTTILHKVRRIAGQFRDRVMRNGYDFVSHSGDERLALDLFDETQVYDRKNLCRLLATKDYSHSGHFKAVLWGNSLLHAVPFALKPFVYDKGRWHSRLPFQPFSRDHMLYQALPLLSEAGAGTSAKFHFFDVQTTHNPWGIPVANGSFAQTDNILVLKWTMEQICSYFDWMRAEGVYDNTRIILVSDHGLTNVEKGDPVILHDPMLHKELWPELIKGIPDRWDIAGQEKIQAFNSLLAVKDFGARAPICRDDHLVSNADMQEILFCRDMRKRIATLKTARKAYLISWPHAKEKKRYNILASYLVKDNVFDLKNWSRIK